MSDGRDHLRGARGLPRLIAPARSVVTTFVAVWLDLMRPAGNVARPTPTRQRRPLAFWATVVASAAVLVVAVVVL